MIRRLIARLFRRPRHPYACDDIFARQQQRKAAERIYNVQRGGK